MPVLQLEAIHHIWQHGPRGRCMESALFPLKISSQPASPQEGRGELESSLPRTSPQPSGSMPLLCSLLFCCWLLLRKARRKPLVAPRRKQDSGRRETPLWKDTRLPIPHPVIQPTKVAAEIQQCSRQRRRPQRRPLVLRAQQPTR